MSHSLQPCGLQHGSFTISISEVVDISSGNLGSSLWFIQPSILHDVLCIEVSRVTIYSLDVVFSQFWTSQLFHVCFCCILIRKQIWWSVSQSFKNFPCFVVIHTVKGFSVVNEAEVDIFLEFPCFLYDPVNVGNLISGSSAFSKPSLYIWKFSVHILLKPGLKNFEHNLTSVWNECNYLVVWTFFGTALLGLLLLFSQ